MKLLKYMALALASFVALFIAILAAMFSGVHDVRRFCEEMKPGLDVHQIPIIARKYDVVGSRRVQDPDSISNRTLGTKVAGKENTWFIVVVAPLTMGEDACSVYHDYHVVLSASMGP